MDITSRDSRGSTPLHWACYRCSELALIYILAWVKPIDLCLIDVDGYTPLHLAVKSAEEFKSCRPIRALLFRGAEKTVRDNNQK
jgi:ankyrin repeat protein